MTTVATQPPAVEQTQLNRIEYGMEVIMAMLNKPQPPAFEEPITVDEAAKFTKRSKASIYSLTSANEIPHYKNGKNVLFFRSELLDWIRTGKVRTSEELAEIAANYNKSKSGIS